MSTLFEAVEQVRGQGQLPPVGPVSIRDLLQRFPPSPRASVRALLLKMFGLNPTTRWGIVVVTVTGVPRTTSLPLSWFERLFGDGDGVSPYFRQISGNRQVFSWRVFGPHEMYTPEKKAELVAQGAAAESVYLRKTAATKGIPVNDFDRFLWVMGSAVVRRHLWRRGPLHRRCGSYAPDCLSRNRPRFRSGLRRRYLR
jgi:hypothetical protein